MSLSHRVLTHVFSDSSIATPANSATTLNETLKDKVSFLAT